MPIRVVWRVRWVVRDGDVREGKPSARTFVLVIVAMTAANPARGLAGRGRG
jgi:hypothetical protein